MSRETLPNRRPLAATPFSYGGLEFVASAGYYDDGRIAEIFISCARTTSGLESVGRDAAVLASIALQYGAPLETTISALTKDESGGPASVIGKLLQVAARLGHPDNEAGRDHKNDGA